MAEFGVHSEVGKLRKVMVHRPDLSLRRLTPTNHDELLFDVVPEETKEMEALVKHEMEHVAEFSVPIVAEIGIGANWRDIK